MRDLKLFIIPGIFMCLLLPFQVSAMSSGEEPDEFYHPLIRDTRGPVMVKGSKYAIWEPAEKGMLLLAGDIVKTEKGGFATIEFASGKIDIYETTVLVIPSIHVENRKKDVKGVVVEEGSALFDINPLGVERGFEFRTKNVQGGVKGTVFSVSFLEGGTAVNVYRGVVEVSDLERSENTSVKLGAGKAVRVEQAADFRKVRNFDPGSALEDYSYNIPPGLTEKGLPGDSNANPKNRGVRDRGTGHGRDGAPGQNK